MARRPNPACHLFQWQTRAKTDYYVFQWWIMFSDRWQWCKIEILVSMSKALDGALTHTFKCPLQLLWECRGCDRPHAVHRPWLFAECLHTYSPAPMERHLEQRNAVLFSLLWGQPTVSSKCFKGTIAITTLTGTWQDVGVRGLTPHSSWHRGTWHSFEQVWWFTHAVSKRF